jgi:hypothetical protein
MIAPSKRASPRTIRGKIYDLHVFSRTLSTVVCSREKTIKPMIAAITSEGVEEKYTECDNQKSSGVISSRIDWFRIGYISVSS